MGMGARWLAPRDGDIADDAADTGIDDGFGGHADPADAFSPEPDPPGGRLRSVLALLPIALALGWLGWLLLASAGFVPSVSPALLATLATGIAPLAVALLLYLIVMRGSRAETGRFARVAADMREETAALEAALAQMADTIVEQNRLLADQAGQLMALGDEATTRLDTLRTNFARDAVTLAEQGTRLGQATDAARVDLGVILTDLPRIDAQVRDLAGQLDDAGRRAHDRVDALDTQIVAVTAHARDAEAVVGDAAGTLATQLSRIEGVSDVAAQRIDAAGTRMAAIAEQALDQAARMLDDLAHSLAAERATLTAIVTESHALIGSAGAEAVQAAQIQIDLLESRLGGFAQRVAREGATVHLLAETLSTDLAHASDRFETLGADGRAVTLRLMEGLEQVAGQADITTHAMDAGGGAIERIVAGSDQLTQAMELIVTALQSADLASTRIAGRLDQSLPTLETFAGSAEGAAQAIDRVGAAIARNRDALEAYDSAIARTDAETHALAASATPALLEALQLVRDAADEAAGHARAAFAAIGRDAASSLSQAVSDIVETDVSTRVETGLSTLSHAAADAADAATAAAERLERQLATIVDTTAAVEARIAVNREAAEASDEADFSRRVALLIESLNSTAIDVAKILSRDVADDAWAAYLRGDRGVFTRRAVRLLDTADVRAIAAHYHGDPDFHDQVNRYIHDFEAMLRRILATAGGSLIGVTLLSSDMGKLYVALAQAIERLRA